MNNAQKYKFIYGPVPSWRLGRSLGIDPLSYHEKICSFDCVYCQLGQTQNMTTERREYVPVQDIINEVLSLPPIEIDYVTFSGAGEPTLAENLGLMIQEVKKIRKEPIAVITNSSLLGIKEVRDDLALADMVVAKLDAASQDIFEKVNRPHHTVTFESVLQSLREFKKSYTGKLALQIMFVKANQQEASQIAALTRDIDPDEVELNTPLRRCAESPLDRDTMKTIESYFAGMHVRSVYSSSHVHVNSISDHDTLTRRGKIIA